MDKDRQIRFLYSPLIFIWSIALGIWFDKSDVLRSSISSFFKDGNNATIAVSLIGAGSLVILLGFIIGTLTVFLLRILFGAFGHSYEQK